MHGHLASVVDALCASDLSALDQVGLQAEAVLLRGLVGRVQGRLSQVLGELDARYQGTVVTNVGSEGPVLFQSTQGWWRDAAVVTGSQAGADLRRAGILRELPLIAQAVVDAELAPAVLCDARISRCTTSPTACAGARPQSKISCSSAVGTMSRGTAAPSHCTTCTPLGSRPVSSRSSAATPGTTTPQLIA